MASAAVQRYSDARFDAPPLLVIAERRLAGQAVDRWRAGGGGRVAGFESHSLTVSILSGGIMVEHVGEALAGVSGISAGTRLEDSSPIAAEISRACRLSALHARPQPFEARVTGRGGHVILLRGIALPIGAGAGQPPASIQVIVNWREVLHRTATARLHGELDAALRLVRPEPYKNDPFSPETAA